MTRSWQTKLIHSETSVPDGYRSLVTPVFRGSTTVFPRANALTDTWKQHEVGYTYGLYGTPTAMELAARIAELEGGLSHLHRSGGPVGARADQPRVSRQRRPSAHPRQRVQSRTVSSETICCGGSGVECVYYRPTIGAGIDALLTRSHSARVVRESGLDHDGGAGRAGDRGGGASRGCEGGNRQHVLGRGLLRCVRARRRRRDAGADQIRGGAQRHPARLRHREGRGGLRAHRQRRCRCWGCPCRPTSAAWRCAGCRRWPFVSSGWSARRSRWRAGSRERPEIARVLHPALPSCPGHELWRRDFTGSTSVFSVEFAPVVPARAGAARSSTRFELFEIGWSWGGVTSLAVPVNPPRTVAGRRAGVLVRFNIGLEAPSDLISDLEGALPQLRS